MTPEHKPRGCDIHNYTDDEDFNKNDRSEDENDFGIEEGYGAVLIDHTGHPEMVHGHNFDYRVDTDNESGILQKMELTKIVKTNRRRQMRMKMIFSEGASESGDGQSDEDGWSNDASAQADC